MSIAELPSVFRRKVKRWKSAEYNALVERGLFEGQRVFLYRGELIDVPPMGALHRITVTNVSYWLHDLMRPDYDVQIQMSIIIPGDSVPEPDAAVFTHEQFSRRPHPNRAELVIEVSDSSLDFDHEKAFDYAAALVPEYWIIDVNSRSIEIHREPVPDPSAPLGYRYASRHVAGEEELIASLLRPGAPVSVKSLLATM